MCPPDALFLLQAPLHPQKYLVITELKPFLRMMGQGNSKSFLVRLLGACPSPRIADAPYLVARVIETFFWFKLSIQFSVVQREIDSFLNDTQCLSFISSDYIYNIYSDFIYIYRGFFDLSILFIFSTTKLYINSIYRTPMVYRI